MNRQNFSMQYAQKRGPPVKGTSRLWLFGFSEAVHNGPKGAEICGLGAFIEDLKIFIRCIVLLF